MANRLQDDPRGSDQDLSTDELNRVAVAAPDLPDERSHFYRCPRCGAQVDRRRLGDVLAHEAAAECVPDPGSRASRPSFIPPLLPTLVSDPPAGDEWQHEIKYDGFRTELIVDGGRARAFTRNGYDWTQRYRHVVDTARALDCESAILDGEMIVQDERGRSDFRSFKLAIEQRPETLVYMAFDLLRLDGSDLRALPLFERREQLQHLLGPNSATSRIQFSDHIVGAGSSLLDLAVSNGLEGIISKRRTSRYRSGRSRSWLKVKCFEEDEFVVIGTATGDRAPVALLAREEERGLVYAGAAMVTLPDPDRDRFWRASERLKIRRPAIPMPARKETGWMRPCMKVRARFLRGEEMLRHATVRSITSYPDADC